MRGELSARAGMSTVRVGCAGWSIPAGSVESFPKDGSHLERYAQVFPCVEINSSFYRPHQPKTYQRWADSVPGTFRFSVKLPRTVTHERRLDDCDALVRAFVGETAPLGDKLGCILVQLPPSLALNEPVVQAFFARLRRYTPAPIACEPRHASWFTREGDALLKEAGVACVQADPPPVAGARCTGSADQLYIRLHGSPDIYYSAYDQAFLSDLTDAVQPARTCINDLWCIFDNTARGAAVPNALHLLART